MDTFDQVINSECIYIYQSVPNSSCFSGMDIFVFKSYLFIFLVIFFSKNCLFARKSFSMSNIRSPNDSYVTQRWLIEKGNQSILIFRLRSRLGNRMEKLGAANEKSIIRASHIIDDGFPFPPLSPCTPTSVAFKTLVIMQMVVRLH